MSGKRKELAKDARIIAENMRFDQRGLNKFSTKSPKTTFIPFASWYDAVAEELEK